MRTIMITRRTVPLDRLEEYEEVWASVLAAATARGCRAWLFRRAGHEDRFSEFLEWSGESPLEEESPLTAALRDLDGCGTAHDQDTWEEAFLS